jgi:hypothetical protein
MSIDKCAYEAFIIQNLDVQLLNWVWKYVTSGNIDLNLTNYVQFTNIWQTRHIKILARLSINNSSRQFLDFFLSIIS